MAGRETGVIRSGYAGDVDAAKQYTGIARTQLGILKNLMSFNNLQQLSRTVTLVDGTTIFVQSVFGQDAIIVTVPPVINRQADIQQPEIEQVKPPVTDYAGVSMPNPVPYIGVHIAYDMDVNWHLVPSVTASNGVTLAVLTPDKRYIVLGNGVLSTTDMVFTPMQFPDGYIGMDYYVYPYHRNYLDHGYFSNYNKYGYFSIDYAHYSYYYGLGYTYFGNNYYIENSYINRYFASYYNPYDQYYFNPYSSGYISPADAASTRRSYFIKNSDSVLEQYKLGTLPSWVVLGVAGINKYGYISRLVDSVPMTVTMQTSVTTVGNSTEVGQTWEFSYIDPTSGELMSLSGAGMSTRITTLHTSSSGLKFLSATTTITNLIERTITGKLQERNGQMCYGKNMDSGAGIPFFGSDVYTPSIPPTMDTLVDTELPFFTQWSKKNTCYYQQNAPLGNALLDATLYGVTTIELSPVGLIADGNGHAAAGDRLGMFSTGEDGTQVELYGTAVYSFDWQTGELTFKKWKPLKDAAGNEIQSKIVDLHTAWSVEKINCLVGYVWENEDKLWPDVAVYLQNKISNMVKGLSNQALYAMIKGILPPPKN